ncbi:hypothetical protein [Jannaschia sp. W003]|uniref:hypothetical protein n=1 Tax=Jannaschia sp. W003 TaxID=2867012 RepID=UPI0021A783E8|nr:hypothetical protein [Jannaschia sp. W003]UWQ21519.1 hypothetical protein K3554_00340 [Jannaschia sp. W003]
MKFTIPALAAATLLAACQPGALVDSDVERGIAGAAAGYGVAKAIDGNADRGAIIGGLAGVYCDDAGICTRPRN